MSAIRMIVGLGNPGPDYEKTRHNAGFWLLDELCWKYKGNWRTEGKFHGDIARVQIEGQDIWLLKPLTFMNLSGQAVLALAHFTRFCPMKSWWCDDELDLPPALPA
jgi:PTH1 family peptidyl-tRNA hydrolase